MKTYNKLHISDSLLQIGEDDNGETLLRFKSENRIVDLVLKNHDSLVGLHKLLGDFIESYNEAEDSKEENPTIH